ncbi:MAG: hypothetical protein ACR2N2_02915, partial [Acidimicrobiia bacterium]
MSEYETEFPSLNPDDPTKDMWKTKRADLQGDRPPGLIELQRYELGIASSGIATFMGRPVAMTPADLKAAEVDVAMLGASMDFSTGMRGAAFGPRAIRANHVYLPTIATGLTHTHVRG